MTDIAQWIGVNGSTRAHFLPVVVAVLTLKMVPPPAAARWTGPRPPLDSCFKTCPSGESPSCTARTRTLRCRPSPCRATHPSPVRGESKSQFSIAYTFPLLISNNTLSSNCSFDPFNSYVLVKIKFSCRRLAATPILIHCLVDRFLKLTKYIHVNVSILCHAIWTEIRQSYA